MNITATLKLTVDDPYISKRILENLDASATYADESGKDEIGFRERFSFHYTYNNEVAIFNQINSIKTILIDFFQHAWAIPKEKRTVEGTTVRYTWSIGKCPDSTVRRGSVDFSDKG
jgi:hypothetical protein